MPAVPLTDEQLIESVSLFKKHGKIETAAKKQGMKSSAFSRRLRIARERGLVNASHAKPAAHASKPAGRSLDDFRAQHDRAFIVPQKIKEALQALGDSWDYELQFSRLAGVSPMELQAYRDEFADYIVMLPRERKRAWAGTKQAAAKMRGMIGR